MLPLWFWIGLGAAVFKAGKSVSTKQTAELTDDFTTSWATRLVPLPVFFLLSIVLDWSIAVDAVLEWNVLSVLLLESMMLIAATVMSTRAFRLGDASRIGPLHSLIPLGVLPTSFVFLGEVPAPIAVVGVVLVVVGGYVLNLDRGDHPLAPVKYVVTTAPGRMVLGVIMLAAFVPILDKIGATRTNPLTWATGLHVFSAIGLGVVWAVKDVEVPTDSKSLMWLVVMGLFSGTIWLFQLSGYVVTNVVYIYALKRVSILLTVTVGGAFFSEEWQGRVLPAILMAVGAIIIGLSV